MEAEHRIVFADVQASYSLGSKKLYETIPSDMVTIDGIPQVIYKLPFDKTVSAEVAPLDIASVLDRVIIGPTQYAEEMKRAFASV